MASPSIQAGALGRFLGVEWPVDLVSIWGGNLRFKPEHAYIWLDESACNCFTCMYTMENGYMNVYTHIYLHTRWAYHAKNTSLYTMPKYSSPSVVHPFFKNFDSKMVVVPSRLWLPLFSPRVSGTVGWGASFQHCF